MMGLTPHTNGCHKDLDWGCHKDWLDRTGYEYLDAGIQVCLDASSADIPRPAR
jgi:hypothetical protein